MRACSNNLQSLWNLLCGSGLLYTSRIVSAYASIALGDLQWKSSLGWPIAKLRGASVLVSTEDQLATALALIELDGIARRLIICPGDLAREHLEAVAVSCSVSAIVSEGKRTAVNPQGIARVMMSGPALVHPEPDREVGCQTEWILLTSGTTGMPKMVVHTLSSLIGAIKRVRQHSNAVV
jgi:hypothetical protein